MKNIIPENRYTFNAEAKTITLLDPYTSLEIAHIFLIRDLTTTETLYDHEINDEPISLSGGIITHTHLSSSPNQQDTDKLQIVIDLGSDTSIPIYSKNSISAIILTDDAGDALTEANVQDKNDKLYKIAQTGAGTVYFYIDIDGESSFKIAGIYVSIDEAETLAGTVQFYRDGTWVDSPAYDFSFTSVEAQEMNGLYPLEEAHHRFPKRLKCAVSGTCNVYAQAVTL